MERSIYRRLLQLIVYLTLSGLGTAADEVHIITPGNGTFLNIVEKGVVFVNQHHLTFRIKACSNCVIAFSNIVAISNTAGNYFLMLIGSKENTLVVVEDSCFSCQRNSKRVLSLLKCDQFVSLWVSWDGKGHLLFGTGNHPGNSTLLEMNGSRRHYPVLNIAVTSSEGEPAHWIFDSGEVPTAFLRPLPCGLSLIPMNEGVPVGSEVVKIILKSAPRNTSFTLGGESAYLFMIQEDAIKLTRVLNYRQRRFHVIQLRSSIPGLSTSVTVEVVRRQRRRSDVHILSPLLLLEELPVGMVFPWASQSSDTGDNYTYTIHGPLMEYFDIRQRELLLRKQLDVDKDTSIKSVVNMTISWGEFLHNILVTISDVNDNPPVFEKELYILETELNFATDTLLTDMTCHDDDISDRGVFDLSISHSVRGVFYMKNTSLYMRSGRSDLALSQPHVYTFLVWAADTSSTRVTQTGTTVVAVKVLPNAGQSDHLQAHFDQEVYEIEEKHLHAEIVRSHLTFHVEYLTEPSDVHVVLDNNGEKYFRIQKRQNSFQLLLKKHIAEDSGFPSMFLMNLMDPLKKLKISTAYILIRRSLTICPVLEIKDIANRMKSRDHKHHVVQDNGCPQMDKTLENVLITISLSEGAGLLALIVAYRKQRRKFERYRRNGSSVTKPVRQEPVGCEADGDVEETAVDDLNKQQTTASITKTRRTSLSGDAIFKNSKTQFQDYTDFEDGLPNIRKSTMKLVSNYQGDRSMSVCDDVSALAPNSVAGDGRDGNMSVYDNVYTNALNSVAGDGRDGSMSVHGNVNTNARNSISGDGRDGSMSVYDNVYTNAPNSAAGYGRDGSMSVYDNVCTNAPNSVAGDGRDGSMSVNESVYAVAPGSVADDGGDESVSVCDSVYAMTLNSVAEDERNGETDSCTPEKDDIFGSHKIHTSFT